MSESTERGYVISYTKQTAMIGEQVTVNTWLPASSTDKDLEHEFNKIGNALDNRMKALNEKVLERTGKNLEAMGIETGTAQIFEKAD